jgi:hypothetical protein
MLFSINKAIAFFVTVGFYISVQKVPYILNLVPEQKRHPFSI